MIKSTYTRAEVEQIVAEKKSYYAIIPANVRYNKMLTANSKLLYGEISALCNERGYCWAKNEYFANLYDVSKTSISKWISLLEKYDYIKTKLIYREGTKEILNRYITLVVYPIEEKLNTPIEEKLKDNTTVLNNTYNNIYTPFFEHWNSLSIIKHKVISKKSIKVLKQLLINYTEMEIKTAMDNYNEIIASPDKYWFNYKWTLEEFLSRGFEKFVINIDTIINNYKKKTYKEKYSYQELLEKTKDMQDAEKTDFYKKLKQIGKDSWETI